METKKPWLSKTIWTNLVLAVSPFIPGVQEWIAANPTALVMLFSVVNIVLRLVTKDKIGLNE